MTSDNSPSTTESPEGFEHLLEYPLLNALLERRSRRFSVGMEIEAGPTAYTSDRDPEPLTETEQAVLTVAACGITGPALADWSYASDAGGNMMARFVGRTVSSPDAIQTMAMIVMDDEATWLARRPQDMSREELAEVVKLTRDGEFLAAWQTMRVKIADGRRAPPVEPPYNLAPNQWSLHAEGTTYFLPIIENTYSYINGLLELLSEREGFFVVDERRMFRPAGLSTFARSNGGHLDDDPNDGKIIPLGQLERMGGELHAIEEGMSLQNLGLMCQAMGLTGFPHYSMHDEAWFEELGFRMGEMPLTRFAAVPRLPSAILNFKKQNPTMSYPLGLERDDEVLLQSYCPPYFDSMEAAVRSVVADKFGQEGTYRGGDSGVYDDPDSDSGWKDPDGVTSEVPEIGEPAINATIALCEYVWNQYGRFPATAPAFHTLMGFQAGHVDEGFYDRYYRYESLSDTHRKHRDRWH